MDIITPFEKFAKFSNWGTLSYVYQIGNSAKKLHSSENSFILHGTKIIMYINMILVSKNETDHFFMRSEILGEVSHDRYLSDWD